MYLFNAMTAALPARLQPYAKATYPVLAAVVAAAGSWAVTGEFNDAEIRTAVVGVVAGLLAYAPPNIPRRAADWPTGQYDHE